jgi:hypothetical protein
MRPFRLLSNLRRYNGQKDLVDWCSTELTQNFKAIEDGFDNIEKNLFLGPDIENRSFNSSVRAIIPFTEVQFELNAENFASYGFRCGNFPNAASVFIDISNFGGDGILYFMRRNRISGEVAELARLRMTNRVLLPVFIFHMEILPPGKYSYFMEGRVITTPEFSFRQVQLFAKVG